MKIIDQDTVNLPAWALSYIVNGDASGLIEGERKMIDRWIRGLQRPGLTCEIVPAHNAASHFTHRPAFGLACEVIDAEIIYLEDGA